MERLKDHGFPAIRTEIAIEDLTRHRVNGYVEREADTALIGTLREEGQWEDVRVTRDGQVIDGWRRVTGARKAGLKKMRAIVYQSDLSDDEVFRLVNASETRKNRSREEMAASVIQHFGEEAFHRSDSRGASQKPNPSLLKRATYLHPNLSRSALLEVLSLAAFEVNSKRIDRGEVRINIKNKAEWNYLARRLALLDDIESRRNKLRAKQASLRDQAKELDAEEAPIVRELFQAIPKGSVRGKAAKLKALRVATDRWREGREA